MKYINYNLYMLTYFKENEDLEHIIKTNLNLDNINISKISTGWTNIVLDIKTDTDSYIAKFSRDDFQRIFSDYERQ